MELILVHLDNGYVNYLQLGNSKTEENSSGSGTDSEFSNYVLLFSCIIEHVMHWLNLFVYMHNISSTQDNFYF
jgi:hypothetical protein